MFLIIELKIVVISNLNDMFDALRRCPGGQIVIASTEENEVCVNGMSFSRRDSKFANAALVVTVGPDDPVLKEYKQKYGVLAGIEFQRDMERRASIMGGGNFTVPVQRLTDFVNGKASTTAPNSSYRLGIKPSACHEIYPEAMTIALQDAVKNHFEQQMPGFLCEDALLHAVETRTSSPVRISRDPVTLQAIGKPGLFPSGEGMYVVVTNKTKKQFYHCLVNDLSLQK